MSDLSLILQYGLAVVLVLLAVLSAQLLLLGSLRLFTPGRSLRRPTLPDAALPPVLVQLPVRNEGPLAVRVAVAAAEMDWPQDKLHIQVLDDGDEEAHESLKHAILAAIPPGTRIDVLRRGERTGFKAGNLSFGLAQSDEPFIAMFDADFAPEPDFLRRMMPVLIGDDGLAFVQSRWGHANRDANWLTRAQGLLLDSHFAVEQEARFRAGLPLSFNGSGGIWRRAAIDSVGGWHGDTLTEDLDLSVRCCLKGWRSAFAADVVAYGELPESAAAWRSQQGRWTKGHAQCAKKLLPMVWQSELPLALKAALTLQMCQFAFYTLAFFSAAISLSLMYIGAVYIDAVARLGLFVTFFGLGASFTYVWLGQKLLGRERMIGLHRALLLSAVFPSGLILANTRATFDAYFSRQMYFQRTLRAGERYKGGWRGGPELAAGVFLPAFAFAESVWSLPFFTFAVSGLISIGLMGFSGATGASLPRRQATRQITRD
ncbi:cellulose synthase/poly-beta-1,6-N-acetylglucosamine synthase-like glycosyltransferase [Rhizomicrobium palustre]|uniref:Cellulose synthase/poly-beta-1,6-N-acetylglucosamine synthase-like glycosyltransferase n=1 Tax=Rhizomicrobium palustre TaxID=189966 RepID=A0A846MZB1_9PROT|nr:glycosyltransferase family 2 protein [Rhizomicrobium palustre]NIK88290.1 cellulose synthase/poly-beta-1,6-N-acetylglucosamine synthase-like glycosyltransferase [Rhizomicrobium palustre]